MSELLQSQLLQPLNITPVQPSLAESNLLILEGEGPSAPAFNEFNPLFTRNRLSLQTSAIGGSNNTFGDEVVHSGVWDNLSYSLGQFHHETDGFRDNNDLTQDVYDAFVQASLSPWVTVQAEYRHKEIENGDLDMRFDLGTFDPAFRRFRRTDTARLGGHFRHTRHSDVVVSLIYQVASENQDFGFFRSLDDTEGYLGELQYLFRLPRFKLVMGGGYDRGNQDSQCTSSAPAEPFCFTSAEDPVIQSKVQFEISHLNAYAYSLFYLPESVTWTLGLSFDSVTDDVIGDTDQPNPKFGMMWDITPQSTFRLAAFRTLKRSLLTNQTIEPTQIAGFNQFFDDFTGTDSRRYGVALDQQFSVNLSGGIEASKRDLIVPSELEGQQDWEEELYRVYVDWLPTPRVAVALAYQYDQFVNETNSSPPSTRTHTLPVSMKYFHPNGFFGGVKVGYVNQEVNISSNDTDSDRFAIADIAVGYRLPKRYGIVQVGVRNLFDEEFQYQGNSGRSPTLESPAFIPDRNVSVQVTLAF